MYRRGPMRAASPRACPYNCCTLASLGGPGARPSCKRYPCRKFLSHGTSIRGTPLKVLRRNANTQRLKQVLPVERALRRTSLTELSPRNFADMGTIVTPSGPRVLLVRHGQCESNVRFEMSTYREEADGLTDLGRQQAHRAGAAVVQLVGARRPLLVSSTLLRARQTARIIAESLGGVDVCEDDRIVEMSSVEDEASFLSRCSAVFRELTRLQREAVIVTHGHVIQGVIAASLGVAFSQTRNLYPFNGGITVLRSGTLESFNMHQHLMDDPDA